MNRSSAARGPRNRTRRRPGGTILLPLLAASLIGSACGDGGGDPLEPKPPPGPVIGFFGGDTTLALSKAAGAAIALAAASRGFAFFDNFLPCPPRGLIDYADRGSTTIAAAHSCNLGDGVVLDGELEVVSATDSLGVIVGVEVTGSATLRTAEGLIALPDMRVDGIDVAAGAGRAAAIEPDSATIDALGKTVAYDARGAPVAVFSASPSIDIPNPGNELAALSDDDVRRVVFDPLLALSGILFGEQLEFGRGPHEHTFDCGSFAVLPDTLSGLTGITASFTDCPLTSGTRLSGDFSVRWTAFAEPLLTMAMEGALTITGGLPSIRLNAFEWNVEDAGQFDTASFRGRLVVDTVGRDYAFQVPISD
ncbi:MAG: hypothetical protein ABFS34_01995 [Gemmatimonadota bacterium]